MKWISPVHGRLLKRWLRPAKVPDVNMETRTSDIGHPRAGLVQLASRGDLAYDFRLRDNYFVLRYFILNSFILQMWKQCIVAEQAGAIDCQMSQRSDAGRPRCGV
jgi:hypothetical protein